MEKAEVVAVDEQDVLYIDNAYCPGEVHAVDWDLPMTWTINYHEKP